MSITDELKDWMTNNYSGWPSKQAEGYAIADRIDAEHEAMLADARKHVYQGYIELPKDADGEYIQPSDIPHLTKTSDGKRLAFRPSLELRQDGIWRLAGWTLDRYRILKPTVEDVLRDVVTLCHNTWKEGSAFEFYDVDDVMESGNIAEFAAKLRLAEGEDA